MAGSTAAGSTAAATEEAATGAAKAPAAKEPAAASQRARPTKAEARQIPSAGTLARPTSKPASAARATPPTRTPKAAPKQPPVAADKAPEPPDDKADPPSAAPPDEPTPPSGRPLPPRYVLGAGIAAAGAVALGAAAYVLPGDRAHAAHGRPGLQILAALTLVAGGWTVWERTRDRGGSWRASAAVGAVAVLAAVTAAWAVAGAIGEYDQGFVGPVTVIGTVGGVAILLAVAVTLGRSPVPVVRPPRAHLMIAAIGAVAVAAAALPLANTVDGWTLVSTTARPDVPLPVPPTPGRVAWTRTLPGHPDDVVAAGVGVVARFGDELRSYDGATGKLRWTYQRVHARLNDPLVSPDGGTLIVGESPAHSGYGTVVGIDAVTGHVRFRIREHGGATYTAIANRVLFVVHAAGTSDTVEGRSLRTGARTFTYATPSACQIYPRNPPFATATSAVLTLTCDSNHDGLADQVEFLAVNDDGQSGWSHRVTITPARDPIIDRQVSSDHQLVAFTIGSGDSAQQFFYDTATGGRTQRVTQLEPGYRGTAGTGLIRLIDAHTGATITAEPTATQCLAQPVAVLLGISAACQTYDPNADTFAADGHVSVEVDRFDGATRSLPVDLGGPFQPSGPTGQVTLVAAPGAVVVVPVARPAAGAPVIMAGLA